jgi:type IV pilus assembly protein PilV
VRRTAGFNNRAFTLIEVLVALVILTISMLGILEAMVVAMQQNLEIYSRDESVRIAQQTMNELRNTPFESLVGGTMDVWRKYKQANRKFTINTNFTVLSANSYSARVDVTWKVNTEDRTHSISSIISRGS